MTSADNKQTVMIIEDHDICAGLLTNLLRAKGYEVIHLVDGKNLIKLANEHLPDLFIMDIQLPGLSGLELTKQLKAAETLNHIPVIAVTAFAMKGDREKCLNAGCDDYIAKPISVPGFIETVERYLS